MNNQVFEKLNNMGKCLQYNQTVKYDAMQTPLI